MTNTPALRGGEDIEYQPKVKFDALFTLNGHSDCVNGAVWCESSILSGGTENPYAQGALQFIASVADDHDMIIWDTYSRQVVKKFSGHTDVVNAVHYIK